MEATSLSPVRALLVAVTAAVSLALPASAASPPYVVQGDRAVGGLLIARGTLAQARQRFGAPSTVRARSSGVECNASWPRIGLRLAFLDFSGRACRDGVLVTATITSRSAWRTAVGLRVGDSVARVRRLYPRARLHPASPPYTGYWLVTRRTCAEVGAMPYPGLLARVRDGRVTALVAGTAPCD
jgi:hypothetical protein